MAKPRRAVYVRREWNDERKLFQYHAIVNMEE